MPIPSGWFQVGYADDLVAGAVAPLRYFDRDLVLFRTASGEAHLLDAFCPHLGAHLGHGGDVVGEHIRCPFHHWELDGQGVCRRIPYASRIPPKARVRAWPLVQRSGILWAYHHPRAEAPTWEPPEVPEAGGGSAGFERHQWVIATHNQEIAENSVDKAHFRYVHGTVTVPDAELRVDGPRRDAVQCIRMATPRGELDGEIRVEAYGLGCSVTRFSGLCDVVLIAAHTPVDREHVEAHFSFVRPAAEEGSPKARLAAAVVRDIVKQMNEDIPIWEHKLYRDRPLLCDGDGPIGAFRKWAKQFYMEESA